MIGWVFWPAVPLIIGWSTYHFAGYFNGRYDR